MVSSFVSLIDTARWICKSAHIFSVLDMTMILKVWRSWCTPMHLVTVSTFLTYVSWYWLIYVGLWSRCGRIVVLKDAIVVLLEKRTMGLKSAHWADLGAFVAWAENEIEYRRRWIEEVLVGAPSLNKSCLKRNVSQTMFELCDVCDVNRVDPSQNPLISRSVPLQGFQALPSLADVWRQKMRKHATRNDEDAQLKWLAYVFLKFSKFCLLWLLRTSARGKCATDDDDILRSDMPRALECDGYCDKHFRCLRCQKIGH